MVSHPSERQRAAAQTARRALDDAIRQVNGQPAPLVEAGYDAAAEVYAILAGQPPPAEPARAPSPTVSAPPPNVAPLDSNRPHQTWTTGSRLSSKGEKADVSLLSLFRNEALKGMSSEDFDTWVRRYDAAHPVVHGLKRGLRRIMRYD